MSEIKVRAYKDVVNNITQPQYATHLDEFHATLTTIANGQKKGDYFHFADGGKPFEAQGGIEEFLNAGSVVGLYFGFGQGAVDLGNLPFPYIEVEGMQVYITMPKTFFDDESNTVPTGFVHDTWIEVDEEGTETVHNTSWKKWVELTDRTVRENVAGDEVGFALQFDSYLPDDAALALLHNTYDIFDLTIKEAPIKETATIKLYSIARYRELLATPEWEAPIE